jgi:hypothetical protein
MHSLAVAVVNRGRPAGEGDFSDNYAAIPTPSAKNVGD